MDCCEKQSTPYSPSARSIESQYRYVHRWSVGDVLLWDHIGTWHNAVADCGPEEQRLMKRCKVLANRVFDPQFLAASDIAGTAA